MEVAEKESFVLNGRDYIRLVASADPNLHCFRFDNGIGLTRKSNKRLSLEALLQNLEQVT